MRGVKCEKPTHFLNGHFLNIGFGKLFILLTATFFNLLPTKSQAMSVWTPTSQVQSFLTLFDRSNTQTLENSTLKRITKLKNRKTIKTPGALVHSTNSTIWRKFLYLSWNWTNYQPRPSNFNELASSGQSAAIRFYAPLHFHFLSDRLTS